MVEKNKKYPNKEKATQARIGAKFHNEITQIQDARLRNGKSRDRISTEKITNMIIRHSNWEKIKSDIIISEEGEINNYGK